MGPRIYKHINCNKFRAVGDKPPNLLLASPLNLSLKMFVFFRFCPDHLSSSTRIDRIVKIGQEKRGPQSCCSRVAIENFTILNSSGMSASKYTASLRGQTPGRIGDLKKKRTNYRFSCKLSFSFLFQARNSFTDYFFLSKCVPSPHFFSMYRYFPNDMFPDQRA